MTAQPGILPPVPLATRWLWLSAAPGVDARACVDALAALRVDAELVIGIGPTLVDAGIPGLGAR
ncbi:MAG TPA: hypothetical protein VG755_43505, partial [Nannocystaceae bacterium]|nr:hypothetical protein [Nannocystaceae bacterium]